MQIVPGWLKLASRPKDMIDIIDGWMSGRIPATRSERARHYLTHFLPAILRRLGDAVDQDAAFACFTDLIGNLPAGANLPYLCTIHN